MKKILIAFLIVIAAGAGVGYYLWNKPHVNLTNAQSDIAVDAKTLLEEYQRNETASNEKYFDKVIAVKGNVAEVMNDEGTVKVSLETGDPNGFVVRCELSATAPHVRTEFAVGEPVQFKGTCSGLNFDVQLDNCVEVR
jgi:flagellar basal body-associated protein FliL